MWRNEVNMRKRERARQQAEELRKMQKMFLLKAMSSPGECDMCCPQEADLCTLYKCTQNQFTVNTLCRQDGGGAA